MNIPASSLARWRRWPETSSYPPPLQRAHNGGLGYALVLDAGNHRLHFLVLFDLERVAFEWVQIGKIEIDNLLHLAGAGGVYWLGRCLWLGRGGRLGGLGRADTAFGLLLGLNLGQRLFPFLLGVLLFPFGGRYFRNDGLGLLCSLECLEGNRLGGLCLLGAIRGDLLSSCKMAISSAVTSGGWLSASKGGASVCSGCWLSGKISASGTVGLLSCSASLGFLP